AFIYMWLRFLQLEGQRESDDGAGPDADGPDQTGFERDAPHDGAEPTAGLSDGDIAGAPRGGRRHPSRPGPGVRTVGVGYIGDDDDDDPELAAYNRALARLADEDEHRAD